MRNNYSNLICLTLLSIVTLFGQVALGQNKIKVEESTNLAKKITNVVPEGKALFVFEAMEDYQFDSDNENIVQPVKEGLLYKLYFSVETSSGAITILNKVADKATINYGRDLFENSLPALKSGEIRYFKLSLEPMFLKPKLECADVTRQKKSEGAADLPTYNLRDALIIFNVVPKDLEVKIEGKKIDTVLMDAAGVYKVYIQPEDQVIVIKSANYTDESVAVGNLNTKEVRYYYVQQPTSDKGIESFDPNTKLGDYLIESIPPGAIIQMTGQPDFNDRHYKTPYTIKDQKSGTEIITLTLDRYEPITDTILISSKKGIKNKSKYNLTEKFAFINCNIEPAIPTSKVLMDGKELTAIKNGENKEVLKGMHTFEIIAPHYYSETRQISLAAGKASEFNIKLKPKMGTLSILSGINTSGAEIIINNKKVGEIPTAKALNLQEGSYEIGFNKPGFISEKPVYLVEVMENKQTNFKDLKMITSRKIQITSSPENGATVYIDNKLLTDKTDLYMTLAIGEHSIKMEREHYKPLEKTFVVDNIHDKFDFKLEALSYKISFASRPTSSNVIIDGVFRGVTPLDVPLTTGSHQIKVERDHYFSKNKTINVNEPASYKMKIFNKRMVLVYAIAIGSIVYALIP